MKRSLEPQHPRAPQHHRPPVAPSSCRTVVPDSGPSPAMVSRGPLKPDSVGARPRRCNVQLSHFGFAACV
eukprot:4810101-Amphidinium_carterae.1